MHTTQEKDFSCTVYSSFEGTDGICEEWDQFVESVGGEIFLTYDWCRLWWKHYGHKRQLRIFMIRHKGAIVGLFPMFLECIWFGPLFVRVVKIVGSDFTLAQFTLPINPIYAQQTVKIFLHRLTTEHWDICNFSPLTYFSHPRRYLFDYCVNGNFDFNAKFEDDGVHTIFDLQESWEENLAKLTKQVRRLIRQNYNRIQKHDIPLHSSLATEENWQDHFDDFISAHQKQWQHVGKAGHFGDWPKAYDFHREMAGTQLKKGRLRLLKVQPGEHGSAYMYSYIFGKRYFEILMGRSLTDHEININLGRLLFSEQAQRAISQDVENIDAMRGIYEYKLKLGGRLSPLTRVRLSRNGLWQSFRVILFTFFCKFVDILYYRIWYCRVAPKLPISHGPLWSWWIRTNGIYKGSGEKILRIFHSWKKKDGKEKK